ncbi:hypothetical protein PGT21_015590 [Puccinia graminis f. sp. tritici]|uniref:HSF-type DNA-binding domain-containing protein n=1 Tax=Puccinia graminis f. sp. tritici TaxID=56615 RepID=A0A5B0MKT7_PUCGR|nr:hypothetical protein PGT21_015590 [Puccinia graminis f. sp. tritici]KAA1126838.1 hypothetical protein PGTUg99_027219 [Puccinia graminis f. sp. tritici]
MPNQPFCRKYPPCRTGKIVIHLGGAISSSSCVVETYPPITDGLARGTKANESAALITNQILTHQQPMGKRIDNQPFGFPVRAIPKDRNFSSFVRQLNMYGFHKVNKTRRGQRGNDNLAAWEFVRPKFHRGRPDLLEQIRRKTLDSESGSQSSRTKDPALTNQSQPSTTTQRFPLDHLSFLPTLTQPHPSTQLVHASSSPFFSHLHQRTKSDCQSELSPAAPGATFNVPDILSTPLPSNALFETGPNPTIGPNTDHSQAGLTGVKRGESLNADPIFVRALADILAGHLKTSDSFPPSTQMIPLTILRNKPINIR